MHKYQTEKEEDLSHEPNILTLEKSNDDLIIQPRVPALQP